MSHVFKNVIFPNYIDIPAVHDQGTRHSDNFFWRNCATSMVEHVIDTSSTYQAGASWSREPVNLHMRASWNAAVDRPVQ